MKYAVNLNERNSMITTCNPSIRGYSRRHSVWYFPGNLADISTSWANFVMNYGVNLYSLVSKAYSQPCVNPDAAVGKRSCVVGHQIL